MKYFPLFLLLPVAAGAATRRVSTAGELEAAVAAARPGDDIVVRAGTYQVNLRITRSGGARLPIHLRAAPGATVVLTAREPTIHTVTLDGASHWRLSRLTVRGSRQSLIAILGGTDNIVSDSELSDGVKYGVQANGDRIIIEGCTFRDIRQPAGGKDTKGVAAWRATRLRIRDNLFSTPGDGVGIGGGGADSRTSKDVRIERNHFHTLEEWYGVWHVENAIDIKNVDGLVITDNVIHHYRGQAGDDRNGVAINIATHDEGAPEHLIADVRMEGNLVYDVNRGVSIAEFYGPGRNVVIRRNVFADITTKHAEKPVGAIFAGTWSGVSVEHNTFVEVERAVVHTYDQLTGFTFRRNVLVRSAGMILEHSGSSRIGRNYEVLGR